ncbi:Cathepsin B [Hypsibius exemplaris]|uniref:Cathepsin B n=1 Tax=Hypsibius exemplaris TaxID=2072580 RepID=A0A1W0WUC1_HYPEX|nr:Cathepsin B [Hypsibius exemplaris]
MFCVFFTLAGFATVAPGQTDSDVQSANQLNSEIIPQLLATNKDTVTSAGWISGPTSRTGQTKDYLRRQAGSLLDLSNVENEPHLPPPSFQNRLTLPVSFDSRVAWPNCTSIRRIFDQGRCSCCWAASGAGVISDRICIASKKKNVDIQMSVQDPLICSGGKENLCNDAYPKTVYEMFTTNGIVTGGAYGSNHGCMPYQAFTQEETDNTSSANCPNKCTNISHGKTYAQDKIKGLSWYAIGAKFIRTPKGLQDLPSAIRQIQQELMARGPLTMVFVVYEDFFTYKSGVYRHVFGNPVAGHAMRLIGWGTEGKTDYWLLANSWGTNWGIRGFVKFVRGEDHLGIEQYLVTATTQSH